MANVEAMEPVENAGGVLAFDFDGTMHSGEHDPPVDERLFDWIEFLRKRQNLVWGICTGRTLPHLQEGLVQSCPYLPDFVVVKERDIFFANPFGHFEPDARWNAQAQKDHTKLFRRLKKEMKELRTFVEETLQGKWVEEHGDPGVVLKDEKGMEDLLELVEERCGGCEELSYERNSIYLRFSHAAYGKGPALREVTRYYEVSASRVLAAGDNFNDLTMLSPEVAENLVCPANAVESVKKRVAVCDGVVAEANASRGLVEAFEHIFLSEGAGQSAPQK